MKNVESIKLIELSENDKLSINGGLGVFETILAGAAIAAIADVINNWDDFKAGLFGRC